MIQNSAQILRSLVLLCALSCQARRIIKFSAVLTDFQLFELTSLIQSPLRTFHQHLSLITAECVILHHEITHEKDFQIYLGNI